MRPVPSADDRSAAAHDDPRGGHRGVHILGLVTLAGIALALGCTKTPPPTAPAPGAPASAPPSSASAPSASTTPGTASPAPATLQGSDTRGKGRQPSRGPMGRVDPVIAGFAFGADAAAVARICASLGGTTATDPPTIVCANATLPAPFPSRHAVLSLCEGTLCETTLVADLGPEAKATDEPALAARTARLLAVVDDVGGRHGSPTHADSTHNTAKAADVVKQCAKDGASELRSSWFWVTRGKLVARVSLTYHCEKKNGALDDRLTVVHDDERGSAWRFGEAARANP